MSQYAEKFWMVWNEGNSQPRHKHKTFQAAKDESVRLARHNPDQKFHVLESVGMAMRTDVSFYAAMSNNDVNRTPVPFDENDLPF